MNSLVKQCLAVGPVFFGPMYLEHIPKTHLKHWDKDESVADVQTNRKVSFRTHVCLSLLLTVVDFIFFN